MAVKLKLTEVSTKNCEDVWNVKMSCFHYLFEHIGTCTVFSNGAALIKQKKYIICAAEYHATSFYFLNTRLSKCSNTVFFSTGKHICYNKPLHQKPVLKILCFRKKFNGVARIKLDIFINIIFCTH